jgi:hypothetical protein
VLRSTLPSPLGKLWFPLFEPKAENRSGIVKDSSVIGRKLNKKSTEPIEIRDEKVGFKLWQATRTAQD